MEEWKEYKLVEVAIPVRDRIETSCLDSTSYISTENMLPNKAGVTLSSNVPSGSAVKFRNEDILISNIRPYFKKIWRADRDGGCSADVICLRASNVIEPQFLYYLLSQDLFFDYVMQGAKGTKMPRGDKSQIMQWPILLPPKSEQHRIASILSALDDKIEVNRRINDNFVIEAFFEIFLIWMVTTPINDNLEQQAQALFKSWFVNFEPFKDGEFVESELGMIPKGWRVMTLGEVCNVFTGKKDVKQSLPKGLYPFFSCSPNHTYSNDYIYDGSSVIIAGNGSYTGRTSFYLGKYDLYQRTYACTIKDGVHEKMISFIYFMMKCLFEPIKMGGTRGSSIPYIVMNDIVLQKFAAEESLVEKYSDLAYSIMKRIQQNKLESRRLASLRDTLLPRLMSGEIKVGDVTL